MVRLDQVLQVIAASETRVLDHISFELLVLARCMALGVVISALFGAGAYLYDTYKKTT